MPMDQRYKDVKAVALDWFRDEDGNDISVVEGLSLGTTLSCVLWQGLSAICHYVHIYGSSPSEDGVVHIPSDASRLRREVASHFGRVSCDALPTGELHLDEQFLTMHNLQVPSSATLVRLVQTPLKSLIRRRTSVYITDWVTAKAARSDSNGIVLYRRSLFKSAIPHTTKHDIRRAEHCFPLTLDDVFTLDRLYECIERNNLRFTNAECNLFHEYARRIYVEIRPALVKATAQFLNLLTFYRPRNVFLPSDGFETWNIIYQLCKTSGIVTHMCVDGYMCVPFWPAQKVAAGDEWLVDRACAYGQAQKSHIERLGFPAERIDVISPPFLEYLQGKEQGINEFDAIVLTWIPYTVNPVADYSSPIRSLETVLKVLTDRGIRRIAVKVKSDGEVTYVKRVAAGLGINIEVLTGRFYEHVRRAPMFVGGLSTALAEVTAAGGRYLVYEPFENGYPDDLIAQSVVVSGESIARTEHDLHRLIESGATSWIGDPSEFRA
jgi:hypothetical protein